MCTLARPRPRPADRARNRAEQAPSLSCCRACAWPRVRQVSSNAKLTNPDLPALTQVDGHPYQAGQNVVQNTPAVTSSTDEQTERGLDETIATMEAQIASTQTHIEMLRRVKQELGELKAENARLKAG